MKNLKLIAGMMALLIQSPAFAKSVKDLEIKCTMQAKVTDVFNVGFHKGLPAHGRFNGTPDSIGFQASLEVLSQEQGCSVLNDKYKIYIGNPAASGGITPALKSQMAEVFALKGQIVELKIQQSIGYKISGYLPLFPMVHSESLSLSFQAGNISGNLPLQFDLNWVYNIPKVENMSDIEKLALAEKTAPYALTGDFHSLFLQLEPQQNNLKKSYAQLIWRIFKSATNSQVLDFHVGGEGSYTGAPLAIKLNHISHIPQMFTSNEIVQLLEDFPTWILAGYSGEDCLNFTAGDLEVSLENALQNLPVMTPSEKWKLHDPLQQIAGPVHFVTQCTEGKVTAHAEELAKEILQSLN